MDWARSDSRHSTAEIRFTELTILDSPEVKPVHERAERALVRHRTDNDVGMDFGLGKSLSRLDHSVARLDHLLRIREIAADDDVDIWGR